MRAAIAALALALAGCGDGATELNPEPTPDPEPPDVRGAYDLAQVNGDTLPAPNDAGCDWRYVIGELELFSDSTFVGRIVRKEDCGESHTTNTSRLRGTYSVRVDSTIAENKEDMQGLRYLPIGTNGSIRMEWRVDHTMAHDTLLFGRQ